MMVAGFVSTLLLVFFSTYPTVSRSSRAVVDLPKCCPHHQVIGLKGNMLNDRPRHIKVSQGDNRISHNRDLRIQTLLYLRVDAVTQCFDTAWLWGEILAQFYTEFMKFIFLKSRVF